MQGAEPLPGVRSLHELLQGSLQGWITLGEFALGGLVAVVVGLGIAAVFARYSPSKVPASVVRRLRAPLHLLGPVFAANFGLPVADLAEPQPAGFVGHGLVLLLIVCVGWAVVGLANVLGDFLDEKFVVGTSDNLEARRIHTRFEVLRRVLIGIVFLLCAVAALMTFPAMRSLGAGLLASAGIAGIVLGVAARPTVETLLASIQLAWTQPIRLDDVVVIEGEWGKIEEIQTTYVVVRIWDLRRLVVPLTYFLHQPFQNWTRTSADLLGAVTVDVDYRAPVEAIRRRAGELVEASPHFDGGFWNLQVVDAGPQTMRLRVLASTRNSDDAWGLRCEVREKLISYLQREHPDCLPRARSEVAVTSGEEASR